MGNYIIPNRRVFHFGYEDNSQIGFCSEWALDGLNVRLVFGQIAMCYDRFSYYDSIVALFFARLD